ncbi:MAG: OAM dimerization domain-containing protein [Bacteroidales bacterium]|nr:OAM dimerization domain-containing protein [Bacteroidales bacterium]
MSEGLYSMEAKDFDKTLDLKKIKPYGDTMNDGKVQMSFTLPVEDSEEAVEAAKQMLKRMGLENPMVVYHHKLTQGFTFFNCYGSCTHTVDFTEIHVPKVDTTKMEMKECDDYIRENIGRKIVVVGASTGTDAHTVGIDAIMNMKGYAGHYGLERYEMIDAYNLGSQVLNEDLIAKGLELHADALLVSQTVTQKDVHIQNMTEFIEMAEAEGIRDKMLLVCGGARVSHELAKELGFDAGFGTGTFADDVASFIAEEMVKRGMK